MKPPSTDDLLQRLNATDTAQALDRYAQDTEKYKFTTSFSEYLEQCLRASGMTPSELIRRAGLPRTYGYQILNGTKNPGRNKVIALCLALSLSLEDVQRALVLAREGSLYPKISRDSILIFCINRHMSVADTNLFLYERGEDPL